MKIVTSVMYFSSCAKCLFQLCAFCLAILIPLTACSDMKTINWREEVKLSSGQIIIVERSQDYRLVGEPGAGTGWLFDYAHIRAVLPIRNVDVMWEGRLQPLAIDVSQDGTIYLVAVAATYAGEKEYALPEGTHHVAFKYSGSSKWQRIPIESVPHEFRPNLLAAVHSLFIKQKFVTTNIIDLVLKGKVDSDPRIIPPYRGWATQRRGQ